jgi:hypothetical protein
MTEKEAQIAATIAQRTEYQRQGNEEGVKECDAKLERLGADPKPPRSARRDWSGRRPAFERQVPHG